MYYEEFELNKTYKAGFSKTITGTEIDLIAQLSGLDLPGFLSPEVAQSMGFKDRVAPGPYVQACAIGLMARQGFLSKAILVQVDGLSFKKPVYPGDKITAETEVTNKKPSDRGVGFVTYKLRVMNQEDKLLFEATQT